MHRSIFPDEFVIFAAMIVAAASFALPGCDKDPPWKDPGPEASFEAFLMDWYRGEYETAFAAIAPEDRRQLTEPLKDLDGKLADENIPDKVDMLVVGRVDNPYDIEDIEVENELDSAPKRGQKVVLQIDYHDGREGEATLVWGGERWFVDLPLDAESVQNTQNEESNASAGSQPGPSDTGTDSGDASAEGAPDDAEPVDHDEEQ